MDLSEKLSILKEVMQALIFKSRTPLIVSWHLTYRCNLRCRYCGFCENKVEELDTRSILNIINELALCGTKLIVLTGGEPFLREDLSEIIEFCKTKKLFVSINSNGTLIKEQIRKLRKVDAIKLSLDGPKHINDFIRGTGVHDKVIEAIQICKNEGLEVNISTVISKHNIDYIQYIIDIAKEYKVGIYFQPADQNCSGDSSKDINSELASESHFKEVINFLIKEKSRGNKLIKNSLAGLEYFCHWPKERKIFCLMRLISCFISADGKIFICDMFPSFRKYLIPIFPNFRKSFHRLLLPYNCGRCWCPSPLNLNLLCGLRLKGVIESYKTLFADRKSSG